MRIGSFEKACRIGIGGRCGTNEGVQLLISLKEQKLDVPQKLRWYGIGMASTLHENM